MRRNGENGEEGFVFIYGNSRTVRKYGWVVVCLGKCDFCMCVFHVNFGMCLCSCVCVATSLLLMNKHNEEKKV